MASEQWDEVGGEDGGELRPDKIDAQSIVVSVESCIHFLADRVDFEHIGDTVFENEGLANLCDLWHTRVWGEAIDGAVE